MSKHKIFITIFIIIGLLVPLAFVLAQNATPQPKLELEGQYPQLPGAETLNINMGIGKYLQYVYVFGLAVSGVAAMIMIIAGGLMYMLSAGNPSKMSEAKDRIFHAVGGLILILAAYLILYTINPDLVRFREPEVELPAIKCEGRPNGRACVTGAGEKGICVDGSCGNASSLGTCRSVVAGTGEVINSRNGQDCVVGSDHGICIDGLCDINNKICIYCDAVDTYYDTEDSCRAICSTVGGTCVEETVPKTTTCQ